MTSGYRITCLRDWLEVLYASGVGSVSSVEEIIMGETQPLCDNLSVTPIRKPRAPFLSLCPRHLFRDTGYDCAHQSMPEVLVEANLPCDVHDAFCYARSSPTKYFEYEVGIIERSTIYIYIC